MTEPAVMAVGGVIGALVGPFWSDPFRDDGGQYVTHTRSFKNWARQSALGGIVGSLLTGVAASLLNTNPILGVTILLGVSYYVYVNKIDPR